MTAKSTLGVVENDVRQGSSVGIRHATLSSVNIDTVLTQVAAFQAAVEGVILGEISSQVTQAVEDSFAHPAAPLAAQRELKWLVRGIDGNGNAQRITIPTADTALVVAGGSEMADGAEKSALVAAIEALWVSNANSPVTVQGVELVGRTG